MMIMTNDRFHSALSGDRFDWWYFSLSPLWWQLWLAKTGFQQRGILAKAGLLTQLWFPLVREWEDSIPTRQTPIPVWAKKSFGRRKVLFRWRQEGFLFGQRGLETAEKRCFSVGGKKGLRDGDIAELSAVQFRPLDFSRDNKKSEIWWHWGVVNFWVPSSWLLARWQGECHSEKAGLRFRLRPRASILTSQASTVSQYFSAAMRVLSKLTLEDYLTQGTFIIITSAAAMQWKSMISLPFRCILTKSPMPTAKIILQVVRR